MNPSSIWEDMRAEYSTDFTLNYQASAQPRPVEPRIPHPVWVYPPSSMIRGHILDASTYTTIGNGSPVLDTREIALEIDRDLEREINRDLARAIQDRAIRETDRELLERMKRESVSSVSKSLLEEEAAQLRRRLDQINTQLSEGKTTEPTPVRNVLLEQ